MLGREEALEAGRDLAAGRCEPLCTAAFLGALAARGERPAELAGLAAAFREAVAPFPAYPDAVDTCGTGGDGRRTFNLSTAAALVVASLGVPVAKHGNRSVSSSCGSADLLEAAGYPISEDAGGGLIQALSDCGFAFLFAPRLPPRHGPRGPRAPGARRPDRLQSIGPLLNPAGVRRQVVGVFSEGRMALMAEALAELGTERSLVVHGEGGYDEAILCGTTHVLDVRGGKAERYELHASDFGFVQDDGAETGRRGRLRKSRTLFQTPGRRRARRPAPGNRRQRGPGAARGGGRRGVARRRGAGPWRASGAGPLGGISTACCSGRDGEVPCTGFLKRSSRAGERVAFADARETPAEVLAGKVGRAGPPEDPAPAIRKSGGFLIAEVKKASPSKGLLAEGLDVAGPRQELRERAAPAP